MFYYRRNYLYNEVVFFCGKIYGHWGKVENFLLYYPAMASTTATSVLKEEIETALIEIGKDRDVLKRADIKPEEIQRLVEKYRQQIQFPDGLFDHFYDSYKLLLDKVEDIEKKQEKGLKELLESIQGYFKACIEAASFAGKRLAEIVRKRSCFSADKVRADIDWLNKTVKIMVLFKCNWPEGVAISEEAMNQLSAIESDFFDFEDGFAHSHQLAMLDYPIQIRIETHWL
jgi:hypothetical protein